MSKSAFHCLVNKSFLPFSPSPFGFHAMAVLLYAVVWIPQRCPFRIVSVGFRLQLQPIVRSVPHQCKPSCVPSLHTWFVLQQRPQSGFLQAHFPRQRLICQVVVEPTDFDCLPHVGKAMVCPCTFLVLGCPINASHIISSKVVSLVFGSCRQHDRTRVPTALRSPTAVGRSRGFPLSV